MSKVVVLRCESYDFNTVKSVVKNGFDLLGGVAQFAKKGERILLKPNLLIGDVPEKCVNTHPSVFRAVAEIFKSTGALVSYGDSPSFGSALAASRKCGLVQAAAAAGIEIQEFNEGELVHFAEGKQNRQFTIARAVLESDGIISLPKLKTHGFEKFTGCIKNQFGCVPGLLKGEFHVKLPDALAFAKMLVDLDRCVKPRLYVMDGVMAMEGNGPRGGNPRKMNVLLFSRDPVALDATVCRMINLDPALVPTIRFGKEFGHGVFDVNDMELLGDDPAGFTIRDFDVDRGPIRPFKLAGVLGLFNNAFVPKPVIDKHKCTKCGTCIKVCPANPKAVNWGNGETSKPPVHNYKVCIRCYCCQELCPEKAIVLKKPLLRRMFILTHSAFLAA
jgi:uncharacterized protein (DUF362 family)/Pyruvate/2-oxoacid:ferredoxin oxidoreductase delta subunit